MYASIHSLLALSIAVGLSTSAVACTDTASSGSSNGTSAVSRPVPGEESELVRIAKEDLAGRVNIGVDKIELIRFDEVTWPDGGLGCPRKDMRYKQMLVNGSLIILRVDGVDYEYHSGGTRPPFYCPKPKPPVPADGGGIDI